MHGIQVVGLIEYFMKERCGLKPILGSKVREKFGATSAVKYVYHPNSDFGTMAASSRRFFPAQVMSSLMDTRKVFVGMLQ